MSNEKREMPIDNINKSISSEKLKSTNINKTQIKIQQRSHSVSNIKQTKHYLNERKSTNKDKFVINLQDIIKEAALLKSATKKAKTKRVLRSKEKETKDQVTTREAPINSKIDVELHRPNSEKKDKSRAANKEIKAKEAKDNHPKIDINTNNDFNSKTQANITLSCNSFNRPKLKREHWHQMRLSNVYKTHNMTGNLLDYMMIFKKRDDDAPFLTQVKEKKRPIVLLNKNQDQSPYKIEINLIPKNNSILKDNQKQKETKDNKLYKSFLPLNISEIYINRKNNLIQSILGQREYNKLFKNDNQSKFPINENEEMKAKEKNESEIDLDIEDAKEDINISEMPFRTHQRNSDLPLNLTDNHHSSKRSQSYFEKYYLIECKLKSRKSSN